MELNKQDFEEYLRSMDPEDIVGIRMSDCDCPIARWARVQVGPEGTIFPKDATPFNMPPWVVQFVDHIDNGSNPFTRDIYLVTASECLEVLAKIEE